MSSRSDRARGDVKQVWVTKIVRIGPQGSLLHREGGYQTGKPDQRTQDPALGECDPRHGVDSASSSVVSVPRSGRGKQRENDEEEESKGGTARKR